MAKAGPHKSIDEILGQRIRELRIAADLSEAELAKSANMSLSDYVLGESGERRFSAVEAFDIARTLGIDFARLLSGLKRV